MHMEIVRIIPDFCKQGNCFKRADFEFTNVQITTQDDVTGGIKEFTETVSLGFSCDEHVEEVKKLFEDIYGRSNK